MMPKKIRKVVIPAAGLGTRFLPATKAMPKEMLTVLDRPLIQHCVEEARAAGIEEFIFIVSRGKTVMEDHFDKNLELLRTLEARGKADMIKIVQAAEIPVGGYSFVRQPEPLGLGHAVWCAANVVGNEPFAVLLPDEVVLGTSALQQAVAVYNQTGGNVITVADVPRDQVNKYGICDVMSDDGKVASIKGFVEKPAPEVAPSTLCIHGRYIFQPEIFTLLAKGERGAGGEIQLTDAMVKLCATQPFHGVRVSGARYDCGNKLGFVLANVAFALQDASIKEAVKTEIKKLIQE